MDIITRSRSRPIAISNHRELEHFSIALLENEMPARQPVRLLGESLSSPTVRGRLSRDSAWPI
ncbi:MULTISPECIES: hypothetical protein [Bradyrhizobium]|uniref:hypothetical protein n=1 Tax=Bradyrhizobium TaxID=374 RepID=UPI003082E168